MSSLVFLDERLTATPCFPSIPRLEEALSAHRNHVRHTDRAIASPPPGTLNQATRPPPLSTNTYRIPEGPQSHARLNHIAPLPLFVRHPQASASETTARDFQRPIRWTGSFAFHADGTPGLRHPRAADRTGGVTSGRFCIFGRHDQGLHGDGSRNTHTRVH